MSKFFFTILFPLFAQTLQAAPLKLALNWKPEPQFGGFYAAATDKGPFAKAGLEVQVLQGGSGSPTIQMLASHQVEYAVVSADEIILSHDRGAKDVIALFATYQTNPQAIMTHAEAGYNKLEDLLVDKNATLLWQAGLPYAQDLKKKNAKFFVKTAPYLGGITNFQQDPKIAQQCFATSEPLAARKAGIKTKVFLIAEAGYNPYTTVLVTTATRLKENPDEVKKMVAAVRDGWARYLQDPAAVNAEMQKLNRAMDAPTFAASAEAQLGLIQTPETQKQGLGVMTEARWQTLVDQLAELKLIKTKPRPGDLFRNF